MITELLYLHILNINRGSLHLISFRCIHLSVFRNRLTKLAFRPAKISTNGRQDSNPVLSDPVSSALTIRPPHPKQLIKGRYFFIYLSLGSDSKCVVKLSPSILCFPQIRHPSLAPPKGFRLGIQKDSQEASYFKFHSENIFREIYHVNLKVNFVDSFAEGLEKLKNRSGQISGSLRYRAGLFGSRLALTQD